MFTPLLAVVNFHHARGPEVEKWINLADDKDPALENGWTLLPFLALPDGAHQTDEGISYFTLRHPPSEGETHATSLFGIACTRQLDASLLRVKPDDVTRSSVQKAIVAVVDSPFLLKGIREKIKAATRAWFEQRDFGDISILEDLQENLVKTVADDKAEKDHFVGLSLRDIVHEYKWQVLTLFKCVLLQPKMLIFGSDCERLCLLQFTLISLMPGLIHHLEDCADPSYNNYVETLQKPTSLKSSDRSSLLSYMGAPLAIFGKGALFSPYTCLQQMDELGEKDTKSFIVGSTNGLFIRQKDKYSDVLINLDEHTIDITSPTLKSALTLTVADRRWIDLITKAVNDTWDEEHPSRPNNHGYSGSEDFIRLQFEEYLLSLISSVKYRIHLERRPVGQQNDTQPEDLAADFGDEFVHLWQKTDNFATLQRFTEPDLYNVVEPKHPCAGGLTIEDIQRRLAQQVSELHLDERFRTGREVIGTQLAIGQKKVSSAFNKIWEDVELIRENQRKRAEDKKKVTESDKAGQSPIEEANKFQLPKAPDLSQAQATVSAGAAKAGAYFSSWGTWASEKRKSGWYKPSNGSGGDAAAGESNPAASIPEGKTEDLFRHSDEREHTDKTVEGKHKSTASKETIDLN